MTYTAERLAAVNQVREHQRIWLDTTRQRVLDGEPFAICNGDEFEEIFNVMGVPVLAINYWNYLIDAQKKRAHFNDVLHARGFPGAHFFALGLASTMDPDNAPWGGLPKPALICGSLRYEMELRVTEHWAREFGCPVFPQDFAFPSPNVLDVPANWYELIRDDWEQLVDGKRLEFRIQQEKLVASYVEQITGRTFSLADLERSMGLLNEQMDYWAEARQLIGQSEHCPVHMRDQMSMYQAMWHRGTPVGVKLVKAYRDEVKDRVKKGLGAYRNEKYRFHYGDQAPSFGQWAEDEHGLVAVSCSYTGLPDCYARTVHNHDPLRALAARHLQLYFQDSNWIVKLAKDHRCDAIIMIEEHTVPEYPSIEAQKAEAAGIPYLAIPREADDPQIRAIISEFVERRLQ
jgi:benzoyl-CoA reductase subunit B